MAVPSSVYAGNTILASQYNDLFDYTMFGHTHDGGTTGAKISQFLEVRLPFPGIPGNPVSASGTATIISGSGTIKSTSSGTLIKPQQYVYNDSYSVYVDGAYYEGGSIYLEVQASCATGTATPTVTLFDKYTAATFGPGVAIPGTGGARFYRNTGIALGTTAYQFYLRFSSTAGPTTTFYSPPTVLIRRG